MLGEFNKIRTAEENKEAIKKFTKREREIIFLLSKGYTNDMIAKKLFISKLTVSTHRNNILRKTKSHNCVELVSFANNIGVL
jgi:DNA-binding NarL/FixJ family response regulator